MKPEYSIIAICTDCEIPMKCIEEENSEMDLLIFQCHECPERVEIRYQFVYGGKKVEP